LGLKNTCTSFNYSQTILFLQNVYITKNWEKSMEKGIFLDRDGVLIEEKGLIYKKEDIVILLGVADALKKLKTNGYILVVVTNQAAIARGLATEEDVEEMNKSLNQGLGNLIDMFYYCPHHPEMHPDVPEHARKYRIKCECRKPLPGMLFRAAKELGIDLNQSYMIGDMITDIIAGKSAGCKTIMVESPNNNKIIKSHVEVDENTKPDYYCKDLYEAVTKIILPRI
jgi:D,D-heptose 1,7-bisphosphate phosphatase